MRLKYQLLVTLLFFSVVLIALLAILNSLSFNRGFTNYVVDIQKQRLRPLGEQFAAQYEQNQGWDWIDSKPEIVRSILSPERPEKHLSGGAERHTPGRAEGRSLGASKDVPLGRPRNRVLLVDSNKSLLVGREIPQNNVQWEPIVLGDTPIGYFGIREPRGLPGELEEVFIASQLKKYGYAAIATILLSALLAAALASRIVKPILKVNLAVRNLTNGEYTHRIDSNSKDELGDVARDINKMAYTLESNQNARQQWMAEISHELRTPVAVLQSELEAMQDGVYTLDAAAVDSLHTESVCLGLLIDDLHELTLSDVGALNYQMAPVDFSEVLNRRLFLAKAMLAQAQLSVSLDVSDTCTKINGDAQRLSQLIDNLLQNSVRYTDEGGTIEIGLLCSDNALTLTWSDSTPGVNEEQLPHLFNLLYRTEESRNREFGGSGLGLAIVKKIVLAHHGTIEASHSPSGGLSINVQLPR